MKRAAFVFAFGLFTACASRVEPRGDASDAIADRADVITTSDLGPPSPCGDAGVCGPGTICAYGRCAGCCDVAPSCVPIPAGCTGELSCGCFATDPCGGCTTCLSVDHDGVRCGNCMCACAAPWTPIETPAGPRAIAELHEGDLVYSVDQGVRVVVPITRTVRRSVHHHAVVRLTLANGAVLEISGRHPTADGRAFDSLRPGDRLGDADVVSVETEAYELPFTYDILPDSDSGAYFVEGALVGSTLQEGSGRSQMIGHGALSR
jgi:hypothetical protein